MAIKLQDLVGELVLKDDKWNTAAKGAALAVGAITAAVGVATVAVAKMTTETFKWAGELDSIQDVMGGTTKEASALNFVIRKSGTETEKFTQGMTILEKSLFKTDGTLDSVGERLADFGINVRDVNGLAKEQSELIGEISKKYNSLSTQQERVNFLTEIFGKSGAGLIDVFDTLAAEGGLDKVTEKVERLGLVIDPQRYENFNRNLEELKLIGLGLAISFTEKIMPSLETFLQWLQDEAPKAVQIFKEKGFSGLASYAVEKFHELDTKLSEAIDKLPWAQWGDEMADHVEEWLTDAFENGQDTFLPKFVVSFTNGIDTAIRAAGQSSSTPIAWGNYWRMFFDNVHRAGDPPLRTFFINWETSWNAGFQRWSVSVQASINNAFSGVYNTVVSWINRLSGLSVPTLALQNPSGQSIGTHATTTHSTRTVVSRPAKSGRQSGGSMLAGHSYNILEAGRSEVFTPNVSGRMDTQMQVTLKDRDLDRIGQAAGKWTARAMAPLVQRGLPA